MRTEKEHAGVAIVCLALIVGLIYLDQHAERHEEEMGRAIVMAARGWQEWPAEAALPLCEWDPTGNYHLVTPCEAEGGLVYYRNGWSPKRWGLAQRKEM